ncbi:hypothetical protein [Lactococcus sp.]|uniref:hypothetical protein n=1 Tax=Lactococcus sp. TaxID=44273 RepID=UPI0035B002D6
MNQKYKMLGLSLVAVAGLTAFGVKTASANTVGTDVSTLLPAVQYKSHVQNIGWGKSFLSNGTISGTTGKKLRTEALQIKVTNSAITGGITYSAHVQNKGWMPYVSNGATAGTTGKKLRVEAIKVKLTGDLANYYDVYYSAHVQNKGWMPSVSNGAVAGTTGKKLRVEAVKVQLVPKNNVSNPALTKYFNSEVSQELGTTAGLIAALNNSTINDALANLSDSNKATIKEAANNMFSEVKFTTSAGKVTKVSVKLNQGVYDPFRTKLVTMLADKGVSESVVQDAIDKALTFTKYTVSDELINATKTEGITLNSGQISLDKLN